MEPEIISILSGGGSVSACVALVIIFLKHIHQSNEKTEKVVTGLTERYAEESRISREAFQSHIQQMTDRVFVVVDNTADAVRQNAEAVRQTGDAVKILEVAVRDLQGRITQG